MEQGAPLVGVPQDPKSRIGRDEGLTQTPKLGSSGSLPQRLGVSSPPFLMLGHSGGHIELPLPGLSGSDVHDGNKVADPDRDFPGHEIQPQDLVSYPLLVVEPPPSDRLSAVVSPTLPVADLP